MRFHVLLVVPQTAGAHVLSDGTRGALVLFCLLVVLPAARWLLVAGGRLIPVFLLGRRLALGFGLRAQASAEIRTRAPEGTLGATVRTAGLRTGDRRLRRGGGGVGGFDFGRRSG